MNSDNNNVVSIFDAKRKLMKENQNKHNSKPVDGDFDVDNFFADIMKKNNADKQKASTDRLKSNKSVLRSYRIKDK